VSTGSPTDEKRIGRPRDKTLTERILAAARQELAGSGVEGFSVRQVARRAQVTRKVVTARWPSAEALVHDALGSIDELRFNPTGDLSTDLTELGEVFIAGLASGALELQLRVTADAREHPDVYAALQRHVLEPMSHALVRAFKAAQAAGQIRSGDVTWLVRAFVGALLATTFQEPQRGAPSSKDLRELTDEILRWGRPDS
jgi:AcrR family transcriptional regulator